MSTLKPITVRVASAPMINSPGVWNWWTSGALADRDADWKRDFLKAFTRGRLDDYQLDAVLAGDYSSEIDGETVVITIPKGKS